MNMIIATHNAHKIEEFGRILAPLGITVQTAELTEAEETGTTFRENAYIKAKSACDETGLRRGRFRLIDRLFKRRAGRVFRTVCRAGQA